MIKSSKGITTIVGRKYEVATDLSVIFGELIKIIGEDETKEMIRIAYEVVTEDSKCKIKKVSSKELKEIIKRDLPEELANILCGLL